MRAITSWFPPSREHCDKCGEKLLGHAFTGPVERVRRDAYGWFNVPCGCGYQLHETGKLTDEELALALLIMEGA